MTMIKGNCSRSSTSKICQTKAAIKFLNLLQARKMAWLKSMLLIFNR